MALNRRGFGHLERNAKSDLAQMKFANQNAVARKTQHVLCMTLKEYKKVALLRTVARAARSQHVQRRHDAAEQAFGFTRCFKFLHIISVVRPCANASFAAHALLYNKIFGDITRTFAELLPSKPRLGQTQKSPVCRFEVLTFSSRTFQET